MKREASKWAALAAMLVLLLSGCGSNRGTDGTAAGTPGGDGTTPLAAETVGLNVCTNCHAGQTAQWVDGAHGNVSGAYGSPATIEDAIGFPYYDYFDDESCATCHDQLDDGQRLTDALTGNVARPVISCESCHGGGQLHYGMGPLPYAQPDAARCGQCHNSTVDHEKYHPEATAIYEKVIASAHYAGGGFTYVMGDDGTVRARCSKCHTDEGAKLYKNISGTLGHDDLVTAFEGKENLAGANPIQCRSCHDAHQPEKLLFDELLDVDNETVLESAEFRTCTNCHQVADSYHGENNKYSWSDKVVGSGEFDGSKVIYDTHFDDPTTTDKIEGYNIDAANDRACRDCHDVHSAELTINAQWARSAHAGKILDIKEADGADPFTAGITKAESGAFAYYPWTTDENTGCVQCHTATGAAAYLEYLAEGNSATAFDPTAIPVPTEADPAATVSLYDADGKFPHVAMARTWDASANYGNGGYVYAELQREFLTCSGCHSDNAGGLRNPGPITLAYTVDSVNPTLADVGKSNVCVNCHAGRGNMDVYGPNASANPANDKSSVKPGFGPGTENVTATHYLNATATLFQADTRAGYEYAGLDYSDATYFAHSGIGLNADAPESGTGPCASCHMGTDEGHTFAVVEKDSSGVITALKSTACIECHAGKYGAGLVAEDTTTEYGLQTAAAAAAFLEAEAEGFHEGLAILEAELALQGLTFAPSYPYFSGASWINEGVFGAAHNYNYLHHEPGAYAHNRYYTKRLIFDSIDWLDNGVLDGIINIDATTYPEAAHWLGAADTADATAIPPVAVGDATRP